MARSFTICRNVTTTLTRADTVLTLNAFAASVLALLQTGGTYAMGADQVYVQWDNTSFNVVIEDAVMAAASGDLAAFKANIRTALLSLAEVSALSVDDISTLEQSSVAGATVTADGAALLGISWAAGTQVPALTAAGVATVLTVGTGANAIPQRDGSGNMPSPFAADAWDYSFAAGLTSLTADGWTLVGSGSEAADTIGGVACRSFTPAGNVATYFYKDIVTPGAGSFELRVLAYLPAAVSTSPAYAWGFFASATGLNRNMLFGVTAAGPQFLANTGAHTSAGKMGGLVGRWVYWTVRVQNGGSGVGMGEVWLGPYLMWSGNISDMFNNTGSTAGRFAFGRWVGTSGTSVVSLASVQYRDGWNEAPPSWTFRSLAGAVGP